MKHKNSGDSGALHDDALAYVQSHHVMSIATSGADGLWNTAVFYLNDGFTLYFVSAPDSRHCRNIAQNPGVAVTIQEDTGAWQTIKGIQLAGTASHLDSTLQPAVIERYQAKFSFLKDPKRLPAAVLRALQAAGWYCISPAQAYLIDNSKSFGNRTEIPL